LARNRTFKLIQVQFLYMSSPGSLLMRFYDSIVLKRPGVVILCILAAVSFLGYKAQDFKLDASEETLILETDLDLQYSRLVASRYGYDDYLLITFTPKDALFSDETMETLSHLRNELRELERVESVVSILDAPLLESPYPPLDDFAGSRYTLESPKVDRKLAMIEFANSPLYQNLLVSPDLKNTAIQVKFPADGTYQDLLARREHFREKKAHGTLTYDERAEQKQVEDEFSAYRAAKRAIRHHDIEAIRSILAKYRQHGDVFLGGVSMVADDMISFIKSDLKIFGLGVTLFLVITLGTIFRKKRWFIIPLLCCALSSISMMGLLGMFGWDVTVISSNFISLQLIITMAITIHLIVRYRELVVSEPQSGQRELVRNTVRLMATPCLYAALTTIAGFGSLVFCNILPVITFGWMMTGGIVVSLVLTFLFFPSTLMLLKKSAPAVRCSSRFSLTSSLARFTVANGPTILVTSCLVLVASLLGISRLDVENSFINYFKEKTEIYQGMKVIDQNLGGTTPLDVIIQLDEMEQQPPAVPAPSGGSDDEDFDEFDEFDEPEDSEKYWFTAEKMALARRVHDYLEGLPETGKVLSLGTVLKIAEQLNQTKPLDSLQLAVLYNELPESYKDLLIKPYASPEHNELRFAIRVKDSEETLRRNLLLLQIEKDLTGQLGLKKENVHLAGLLLLYNNMLQSLFDSQILTLGLVLLALITMFLILFRSLKIALVAIAPNLLAVATVLGVMGWLNIPLDMMTITIASISIGIGVDNTIHYLYRFRQEIQIDWDYHETIYRCHGSIGRALYYTSVTIIIGFSILALSNFIPTIYFGLLTGLAMVMALLGSLTLLPQLLVVFKPFGSKAY
jgi:predicted RND superfamily exporter protein